MVCIFIFHCVTVQAENKISPPSGWSWGKKFGLEDGVPANGNEAEIIVHAD